jgi:hypothetical protein
MIYAVINTFAARDLDDAAGHIISKHRSESAANAAMRRTSRGVAARNGRNAYLPMAVVTMATAGSRSIRDWIADDQIIETISEGAQSNDD